VVLTSREGVRSELTETVSGWGVSSPTPWAGLAHGLD